MSQLGDKLPTSSPATPAPSTTRPTPPAPQPSANQPATPAAPTRPSTPATPPATPASSAIPSAGSDVYEADVRLPAAPGLPLRPPSALDLTRFNALTGDTLPDDNGDPYKPKPVKDMKRLFVKQVILDDDTTINVATVRVPGFIGVSNSQQVTDPDGKSVSGHADVVKFLERDNLLICTYQWHKDRYGKPIDTRKPLSEEIFKEAFIKNEGHHTGAIVPARRKDSSGNRVASYGTMNSPSDYHQGLYGKEGFLSVAQRLAFSSGVTPAQAKGYTDSIICWMGLLNAFARFPSDYNGGDPTRVNDRATLREFLKNGLLASLGDARALAFFQNPVNKTYCAEFIYISLNTPVHPFNLKGLTALLDGDAAKAKQVLAFRDQQNKGESNPFSRGTNNPEFKAFNIQMPVVPEDLLPLDQLLAQNGQQVAANSLPFPPFKISQVIRRAFRSLLPRHAAGGAKLVAAQARLFRFLGPALLQQMGLESADANDPRVLGVNEFIKQASQLLDKTYSSDAEFDQVIDGLMVKADEMLVGDEDRMFFVPPRIYVDLGQNDGDDNLPQGWGFRLETIAGMIGRSTIRG